MATLLNYTYPEFRIFHPASGTYREFKGGKLEIEKDDPAYHVVMEEAARNPGIVIFESVTQCEWCGETFTGKVAPAALGKHKKDAHFDKWLADKDAEDTQIRHAEIKAREGIPCDVCRPVQTFATEDELTMHVRVMHAGAPMMDAEGNTPGDSGVEVSPIPAATPKKG